MDREKGKEKSFLSHIVSSRCTLSDSHGPRARNIKSIRNHNDIRPDRVIMSPFYESVAVLSSGLTGNFLYPSVSPITIHYWAILPQGPLFVSPLHMQSCDLTFSFP
jgi:hypothetical protein